jgi:ribonuclease HI
LIQNLKYGLTRFSVGSFLTLKEAEAYLNMEPQSTTGSSSSLTPKKWYAVANGRSPGIYTDWETAQKQITGWSQPKFKSFPTKSEAEQFMQDWAKDPWDAGKSVSKVNIEMDDPPQPNSKKPRTGTSTSKKDKNNGSVTSLEDLEYEPGAAPLDIDVKDGFDVKIKLNRETGKIEYKTPEELTALRRQPVVDTKRERLKVYTDGSSLGNGKSVSFAGVGVFFGAGDSRNVSEPLSGSRQTNQRAELTAIQRALDITPIDRPVEIFTDSLYSIKCVTEWFQNWRAKDWRTSSGKPVENREIIEAIINKIEAREKYGAKSTIFTKVKGHANDPGNEAADMLAVNGAVQAQRASYAEASKEAAEDG